MKLTLYEIEICLNTLIEMLRTQKMESVETGQRDLYWSILSEDWVHFQKEPKAAVGSFDDDFKELRRLLNKGSSPSLVDLERIAAVLKLIATDLSDED